MRMQNKFFFGQTQYCSRLLVFLSSSFAISPFQIKCMSKGEIYDPSLRNISVYVEREEEHALHICSPVMRMSLYWLPALARADIVLYLCNSSIIQTIQTLYHIAGIAVE